jgi:cell division inhibitor SulA/protein ImuA
MLDAGLPGGGWPRAGLVEILTPQPGVGELHLLIPTLARLTGLAPARWVAWIAPPFEPYAPALAAHDVALDRQLVVRTRVPLWAMEQALGSGACEAALAWVQAARPRDLRRLQLATGRGRTLGFVFRSLAAAREASPAELRLSIAPRAGGVEVALLKSRGGSRERIAVAI